MIRRVCGPIAFFLCILTNALPTVYAEESIERYIFAGDVWADAKIKYKKFVNSLKGREPDQHLREVMEKEQAVTAIYVEVTRDKEEEGKVATFRLFFTRPGERLAREVRPNRLWDRKDVEFMAVLTFLKIPVNKKRLTNR